MLPQSARTKPSVQGYPLLKWINIVLSEPLGCEPSHCSISCHLTFSFFFLLLAILPIASSCCTEVSHHISRRLLERVTVCHIQRADGDCDLAAVM